MAQPPADKVVDAVRKVNGFMASASYGQLVVTTEPLSQNLQLWQRIISLLNATISITSSNGRRVQKQRSCSRSAILLTRTCSEGAGAYLIGVRIQNPDGTSFMLPEGALDGIANVTKFKRPTVHQMIKFSDVVEMSQKCQHEGYVREPNYPFSLLLKIKSPHYLAKKFVMRGVIIGHDLENRRTPNSALMRSIMACLTFE